MARDIDWITTDYNNQNAPSTFLTYTTGSARRGRRPTSTTSVMLLSFDATATCAGTTLRWQMAQGFDTLGFNVFREVNGERVQLNPTLIYASALTGATSNRYELFDPGLLDDGRTYWLEDVDFGLDSVWYGPIRAEAASACAPDRRPAPVATVGGAAAGPAATAAGASAPGAPQGCSFGGPLGGGAGTCLGFLALLAAAGRRRRGPSVRHISN